MKSFIEDSYVHPDAVKKYKINAEAKLSMKINKKSQLLFRGSLLGHLRKEKKAINQGGDCWVKNMVYTLLF